MSVQLQNSNLPNSKIREAYLNEYKGILFEFMVANHCTQNKNINLFYQQFPSDFLKRLYFAEEQIRNQDLALYSFLNEASFLTAQKILALTGSHVVTVTLLGKLFSDHRDFNKKNKELIPIEADMALVVSEGESLVIKKYYISLKFCKNQSFVNTKSGGLKTFISKYFYAFPEALNFQKKINQLSLEYYSLMVKELHQLAGLKNQGLYFSAEYKSLYSELPGGVPKEFQNVIFSYYHRCILMIEEVFHSMAQSNFELFTALLTPLCGISSPDLIQAKCFYHKAQGQYSLSTIQIDHFEGLKDDLKQASFAQAKNSHSSFELILPHKTLQIRLKPMNVYTTMALKVNCSIKERES